VKRRHLSTQQGEKGKNKTARGRVAPSPRVNSILQERRREEGDRVGKARKVGKRD